MVSTATDAVPPGQKTGELEKQRALACIERYTYTPITGKWSAHRLQHGATIRPGIADQRRRGSSSTRDIDINPRLRRRYYIPIEFVKASIIVSGNGNN